MSLVDIYVIEGVYSEAEKQEMIQKITDVMVEISGKTTLGITWVRINEVPDGRWGIAGRALTAEDIKSIRESE